jgi:hypothetical protein
MIDCGVEEGMIDIVDGRLCLLFIRQEGEPTPC